MMLFLLLYFCVVCLASAPFPVDESFSVLSDVPLGESQGRPERLPTTHADFVPGTETVASEEHLTSLKSSSADVQNVHITSEVRTVAVRIEERLPHSYVPPIVFSQRILDKNLEPTEIEPPEMTPTTVAMIAEEKLTTSSDQKEKNVASIKIVDLAKHKKVHEYKTVLDMPQNDDPLILKDLVQDEKHDAVNVKYPDSKEQSTKSTTINIKIDALVLNKTNNSKINSSVSEVNEPILAPRDLASTMRDTMTSKLTRHSSRKEKNGEETEQSFLPISDGIIPLREKKNEKISETKPQQKNNFENTVLTSSSEISFKQFNAEEILQNESRNASKRIRSPQNEGESTDYLLSTGRKNDGGFRDVSEAGTNVKSGRRDRRLPVFSDRRNTFVRRNNSTQAYTSKKIKENYSDIVETISSASAPSAPLPPLESYREHSSVSSDADPPTLQERLALSGPTSSLRGRSGIGTGTVAAIVIGVLLSLALVGGGATFFVHRRLSGFRPKILSPDRSCANSDSGGYLDDQCRVAYVNSQIDMPKTQDDLVSLDNDSFLNSLESMTIQNLWTDNIRHTKL